MSYFFCAENAEKISALKPKKETILFSKNGSVRTAIMVKENMNLVTSGAVLHFSVKNKEQFLR
ncbi:MAG: hypothetical protein L3J11_04265 [Draconibacterium sp.]|nr:hypothetical protein [Draconibacterium sp.]